MDGTIEVFICYARQDEVLRQKLENHLSILKRQGIISLWHDRIISPGADWQREIETYLKRAHIILLLVSPDFIASEYCYGVEVMYAMDRQKQRLVKVLPIILRPVSWHDAPFGKLQALPTDARPITSWQNEDEAFYNVVEGIRTIVTHPTSSIAVVDRMEQRSQSDGEGKSLPVRQKWKRPLFSIILTALIIGVAIFSVPFASNLITKGKMSAGTSKNVAGASPTTSPAHAYPSYLVPSNGVFSFFDSLSKPDDHWNEDADLIDTKGQCYFKNGVLHVEKLSKVGTFSCDGRPFSNFAFEVQMQIIHGDCGGITFRDNAQIHSFYQFDVCVDTKNGYFDLFKVNQGNYEAPVITRSMAGIIIDLKKSILLAVTAQGSWIKLYVNKQEVANYFDSSFAQGQLNLLARDNYSSKTEVIYSNATLWTF